jgi:hypothetical protein
MTMAMAKARNPQTNCKVSGRRSARMARPARHDHQIVWGHERHCLLIVAGWLATDTGGRRGPTTRPDGSWVRSREAATERPSRRTTDPPRWRVDLAFCDDALGLRLWLTRRRAHRPRYARGGDGRDDEAGSPQWRGAPLSGRGCGRSRDTVGRAQCSRHSRTTRPAGP